jgi:hypothetical protein
MKYLILTVSLGIAAVAQIDRPFTGEGLIERHNASQAEHKDKLKVIVDAEKYILQQPSTGIGPQRQASLIHLQIDRCLADGDLTRKEMELNSAAAGAVASAAQELEAKAANLAAPADAAAVADLTRRLEETRHRIGELKTKPNLAEIEQVELQGLESSEKQLNESLQIMERARVISGDRTKIALDAQKLREKEQIFRIQAREAGQREAAYNGQCSAYHSVLRAMAENQRRQHELEIWGALDGSLPSGGGGKAKVTSETLPAAPDATEVARIRDENKELRRILHDPDALGRLLQQLNVMVFQSWH